MALTEEQLKELALRVDAHLCSEGHVATSAAYAIAFAANLVAALPKPEPVGNLNNGKFFWNTQGGPEKWRDRQNYDGPLYAEAPIAQPASAPSEQKPRFECWSTNEGDSWYEHPADAELLYDVLGNSPKVGDEFEVMAGWCSVQARYRIASQTDDDFEVECISHPESNTAPQPDYKAQRDAERYLWLRDHNKSWSWNPSQYNKEIVSGFAAFNTGYLGFEIETAIDTAIASVKCGE